MAAKIAEMSKYLHFNYYTVEAIIVFFCMAIIWLVLSEIIFDPYDDGLGIPSLILTVLFGFDDKKNYIKCILTIIMLYFGIKILYTGYGIHNINPNILGGIIKLINKSIGHWKPDSSTTIVNIYNTILYIISYLMSQKVVYTGVKLIIFAVYYINALYLLQYLRGMIYYKRMPEQDEKSMVKMIIKCAVISVLLNDTMMYVILITEIGITSIIYGCLLIYSKNVKNPVYKFNPPVMEKKYTVQSFLDEINNMQKGEEKDGRNN